MVPEAEEVVPEEEEVVPVVAPEPKRLVVARKVDAVLELEEALELPEVEEVEPVVEVDELELLEEVPPPPPRMPRSRGAESVANLSADVTPVSRMVRCRVPDATTAVRMPTLPPPVRTGSVSRW